MKVLLSWLQDYVDIKDIELKELCKGLTNAGFEIEEVVDKSKGLDRVFVSQITDISKHPNADKLVICQVDYDSGKTQIVTHADNMKVGDKIPLALDGADLPNGTSIKNGSLRGIASNGMLCAGEELCIDNSIYPGAEVDGLLILKGDAQVGENIAKVLGLNEVILDVNVLPNRADCNSIYGIAKEIGAIFDRKIKPLSLNYTTTSKRKVNVSVRDFDLCPRYMATAIENITMLDTPDYIKKRLTLLSHTPHNLFVDITNYVLLEIGQPMHAFDLSKIEGEEIIVRRASLNEKLIALDEKEYTLSNENLVIANKNEAMVIAGIMGGLNSGTYSTTKNVLLESANFHYANIRRSSHALGLSSDSSIRYSKGINIENTELAMKRALNIISSLNAGSISEITVDINNGLPKTRIVKSSINRINERLGLDLDAKIMIDILNSLGIVTTINNDELSSTIPPERTDIEHECDICEEVGRIYGLDKIKEEYSDSSTFTSVGELTIEQININKLKIAASLNGYNETMTWQFGSPKMIQNTLMNVDEHIVIKNPIGLDYSVCRRSLTPAMLNSISFNLKQGNKELKLFELARVFLAKSLPLTELPDEHNNLCLGTAGVVDFYKFKNDLNKIVEYLGVKFEYRQAKDNLYHPGICAEIYLYNRKVGIIGEIHPTVLNNFEINQKVYVAEINLSSIITRLNDKHTGNIPDKLPCIERDLALIVDIDLPVINIINTAKKADKQLIADCKVFDVYTGSQVEKNKKSVAIKLFIRQGDKPYNEQEIATIVDNVLQREIKEHNAKLR